MAVAGLRARYKEPKAFFRYLTQRPHPIPFSVFRERVSEHHSYGGWFAFKGADLVERVLRVPVEFSETDVFLYDEPRAGAELVCRMEVEGYPLDLVGAALEYAQEKLGELKAPPHYDRLLNLQEYETMFCKFKAHVAGRYKVGKDIREIRHGLQGWLGYSSLARQFEAALPLMPKEKCIWD
jgi:hypothetical protein